MTNRPKDIGTAGESAVVRYLRANGFPQAERRALTGALDQGDITGIPGLVIEVKSGKAAENASDGQIDAWLAETELERRHASADLGLLVTKRRGVGPAHAGSWWVHLTLETLLYLAGIGGGPQPTLRTRLEGLVPLLRAAGYGDPL